jgi:hypothetical protein
MTVNPDFIPPTHQDISEEIGDLMEQGNEKMQWARRQANILLEHANFLEQRANSFRRLAAEMVLEAQNFIDELADLITAEFPMDLPGDTEETVAEIE